MSSNALSSQGMTLGIGDGASPEAFTTISDLISIDGPGGTATEIDTTDLSSTSKEFVMGLQDEGEMSVSMNFIPQNTQHALLRTKKSSGVITNYRLTFTDSPASTWTFAAYVKGLPISNGVDATTQGSLTLRLSGSITEA